jgi:hypothetical protein
VRSGVGGVAQGVRFRAGVRTASDGRTPTEIALASPDDTPFIAHVTDRFSTRMKNFFHLLSLCVFVACVATTHAADKTADVAGEWHFEVETTAGSGSPTFTFKQDGEKITGTYDGAFGTAELVGSVIGNEIKFTFKVTGDSSKELVEYAGTVDGKSMKGTVKIGSLGEGTFTGKLAKKTG